MNIRDGISRRDFLFIGGAAALAPLLPADALAAVATETPLHGISPFGDLKYGPDFSHFDYASPDAPKGGTFNFMVPNWNFNQNVLTFNTLNSFVPRGDAPPRMELCFDSLFSGALDEPASAYGLVAETVTISADRNSFVFKLRPEARFHDGSPLTAADVAFSYKLLKEEGHPILALMLSEMTEAVADDPQTFRLVFSGKQSSRTIFAVIGFPILSEAYLSENPFDASQLKALLGSGAFKVGRFSAGQWIEYDRVEDYWARDLAVNRGLNHFDRLRIEFFRDRQAAFEAFKKGDIHFRQEFTSRVWATGYDFPAVTQKKVVMREFPGEKNPTMQAWAINQRRARFQDPRVRRAIGMCFDFEWTNRNLFYGAYERSNSTFEKSDYKTSGAPSPEELELLETFRGRVPEEVFGEVYVQPVTDGSGRDRRVLREARQMLIEAGWKPSGQLLANDAGQRLTLEFLTQEEGIVRLTTPYVDNLRAIGVDATIRTVDASQYQARQRDFDFDVVLMALSFTPLPSQDSLTQIFHSRSADLPSLRNLPGTKDPVVDELVEMVGRVDNTDDLTVIMRALDRVLRARSDWIPTYYMANHKAAYWDMFGFKEPKPDYGFPVESLWWHDEEKARTIGRA
ncbi:extracellular solute-binding protein [Aquamicrobium sp. LC103]|uniref:extracellular solute-binding protein n=1 Tax=Aquamicrobium sp. LC103 TaxID=1120658 RepID=UPI00063EA0D0|nr:extracellular solute-binding protein [Aquamicrobium sp. LC103]TKT74970.1 ABC transporter substrate-binding protein [Aquamicrobium sp. LC103]